MGSVKEVNIFNFMRVWVIKLILNVDVKQMNIYKLPGHIYLISVRPVKRFTVKFKNKGFKKFKLPLDKS